jgi:hypothetical protein
MKALILMLAVFFIAQPALSDQKYIFFRDRSDVDRQEILDFLKSDQQFLKEHPAEQMERTMENAVTMMFIGDTFEQHDDFTKALSAYSLAVRLGDRDPHLLGMIQPKIKNCISKARYKVIHKDDYPEVE